MECFSSWHSWIFLQHGETQTSSSVSQYIRMSARTGNGPWGRRYHTFASRWRNIFPRASRHWQIRPSRTKDSSSMMAGHPAQLPLRGIGSRTFPTLPVGSSFPHKECGNQFVPACLVPVNCPPENRCSIHSSRNSPDCLGASLSMKGPMRHTSKEACPHGLDARHQMQRYPASCNPVQRTASAGGRQSDTIQRQRS